MRGVLESPGKNVSLWTSMSLGDGSDGGGNCHSLKSGTVACLCLICVGRDWGAERPAAFFFFFFNHFYLALRRWEWNPGPVTCRSAVCRWATTQPLTVFSLFTCVAPGSKGSFWESVLSTMWLLAGLSPGVHAWGHGGVIAYMLFNLLSHLTSLFLVLVLFS